MDTDFPEIPVEIHAYQLLHVPMSDLVVDESYQRAVQNAHVNRIADEFDSDKFRPLMGNKRSNGKIAVVDGLQRASALQRMGYTGKVPVVVPKTPMSVEIEAKMFYAMNLESKPLKPVDAFNSLVLSGNSIAVQIMEVLEDLGLTVSSTPKKDFNINAAGALKQVVVKCGGKDGEGQDILKKTLESLVIAYCGSYDSLSRPMILGVANFLYNLNEKYYDSGVLVSVLETTEPTEWASKGREQYATSSGGSTQTILAVQKALLNEYYEEYSKLYFLPSSIDEMSK